MAKTVLISGGTEGIGESSAKKLLEQGYNVATFSRNKEKVDALKKDLDNENLLSMVGDITVKEDVRRVVEETISRFGKIDILINNAGFGYYKEADDFDDEVYQKLVQTNLVGLVSLTKEVIPIMKKQKSGLIINISSISGKMAFSRGSIYSSTKFGVMGFTDGIRKELKPHGIKVCAICPGMVDTPFYTPEELERRMKDFGGKAAMLEAEDVSRTVLFVCNQADHCDIQELTVMPF